MFQTTLLALLSIGELWSQYSRVPNGPCGAVLCASLRFHVVDAFGKPVDCRVEQFEGIFKGMKTVSPDGLFFPTLPIGAYRYKLSPVNPMSPYRPIEGSVLVEEGDQWITIVARGRHVGDHSYWGGAGRVLPVPESSKVNWARVEEVFASNVVEEVPIKADGTFVLRTLPHEGKYMITILSGPDVYATRQLTIDRDTRWPVEIRANMRR